MEDTDDEARNGAMFQVLLVAGRTYWVVFYRGVSVRVRFSRHIQLRKFLRTHITGMLFSRRLQSIIEVLVPAFGGMLAAL